MVAFAATLTTLTCTNICVHSFRVSAVYRMESTGL